jgi:L-seryl-tRNA(Ser) seleniumtransferase
MPIPPFRGFGPAEAIKQLTQWVNQPMLTHALKEAAQKLGVRESPSLSSLQELLRQAGRWIDVATEPWSENHAKLLTPGINATGEWFSGRWTSSRFSGDILAMLHLIHSHATEGMDVERRCSIALASATGAADALVMPNLGVAVNLMVRGLSNAQRIERVLLPRKHGIRIPSGPSLGGSMLPEMLEACGIPVREIGSNQECLPSDFERSVDGPKHLLVLATCGSRQNWLQNGIDHVHTKESLVCDIALDGSLHDLIDLGIQSPALSRRWDKGPDLMIVPGHDLLAGPECGIILGKRDVIELIRKFAESTGMLACRGAHLLLMEALRATATREGWNSTPIGAVLNNSLANLENRATRIALQCDIPHSEVRVETVIKSCKLGSGVWHDVDLDSAVLRIFPREGVSPSRIAERMSQHTPAIWVNVFSDHIECVLRTVDPAEDSAIVSALCSLASDTPPTESQPDTTSH